MTSQKAMLSMCPERTSCLLICGPKAYKLSCSLRAAEVSIIAGDDLACRMHGDPNPEAAGPRALTHPSLDHLPNQAYLRLAGYGALVWSPHGLGITVACPSVFNVMNTSKTDAGLQLRLEEVHDSSGEQLQQQQEQLRSPEINFRGKAKKRKQSSGDEPGSRKQQQQQQQRGEQQQQGKQGQRRKLALSKRLGIALSHRNPVK